MDVVPPPSITFVESLITVRSEHDPFLLVEAITYNPRGDLGAAEDVGVGGGSVDGSSGGIGGGGVGDGEAAGVGSGTGGGGVGSGYLTFGLSSKSCAVVGFTFLAVGLLLLVQPMFSICRWWKEAGRGSIDGMGGMGRRRGKAGRRGGGSDGPASRLAVGQWRYGQVGDDW